IRSASVDLPWSMWAMMLKLRRRSAGVWPGAGAAPAGIVTPLSFHCAARTRLQGTGDVTLCLWGRGFALPRYPERHAPPSTTRTTRTTVANIKSQIKRIKTNNKAHERNKAVKSSLRTASRRVREALAAGDVDRAEELARDAGRKLDKAVSKGVIHKNQAANKKSALDKAVAGAKSA